MTVPLSPILVTGAHGLLGSTLLAELALRGIPAVGWSRSDADLARPDLLPAACDRAAPRAIIHCAAWTQVDRAEEHAAECHTLNVDASARLAGWAAQAGAMFVYTSSGGVFDGTKASAYDERDTPAPRTVYHRSKFEGETAVRAAHPAALVVRVGWLYGGAPELPRNFVAARIREARGQAVIRSTPDFRGSPTWSRDAARRILELLAAGRAGLCHVANDGVASRLEYVAAILRLAGLPTRVEPAAPGAFARKAPVPANEALCSVQAAAWGLAPLRPWPDALADYIGTDLLRSSSPPADA
jgi:dTDP-4-dehydrorhamnose reductase